MVSMADGYREYDLRLGKRRRRDDMIALVSPNRDALYPRYMWHLLMWRSRKEK